MHARTQIREAIKTALSTISSADMIFNMVSGVFPENKSINILTLDETINYEHSSMDGLNELDRELRVQIEVRAPIDNETTDNLDTITDDVEEAILNDSILISMVYDIKLESLSFFYDSDSRNELGKSEMIFTVLYTTDGLNPSQIIT